MSRAPGGSVPKAHVTSWPAWDGRLAVKVSELYTHTHLEPDAAEKLANDLLEKAAMARAGNREHTADQDTPTDEEQS